jgi:UDP-2,3-diacylglucosamine pyrophosphatase LpxH
MVDSISRSVFVISDLHIGGIYGATGAGRGFRINTHVLELAQFIRTIAQIDPGKPSVELVINGDIIDFLAEKNPTPDHWHPFTQNPEAACRKLEEIAERDRPFFDALRELLDKGNRLTLLLGNHDIELALPPVRQKLKELIGADGHHDYNFVYDGDGYIVGDALIEHGNRYDPFNMVDHESLRRVSILMSRRQAVPENCGFDPPAGSKLVSWVINAIKERYKFVDLLQPPSAVVVPFLLALEPGYRRVLGTVARLGLQARRNRLNGPASPAIGGDIRSGGSEAAFGSDIGACSLNGQSSPPDEDEAALEEILSERFGGDAAEFLETLSTNGGPRVGSDISTANVIDHMLGIAHLLFCRNDQDVDRRLPLLLKALRALQPDRSFELGFESATEYTAAANNLLDGGFHYVLFGHTHLAKKIELRPGCWYLNSGTWADLMRIPPEIITGDPDVALARVRELMRAIQTNDLTRWIVFKPTYLRLDLDAADRVIQGDVCEYAGEASVCRERTRPN